ncbi:hypothetical protein AgCh_024655 [Apium graveolens]
MSLRTDVKNVFNIVGSRKVRIFIAGGGIGGLVLALGAKKRGFDVKVFEKDLSAVRGEVKTRKEAKQMAMMDSITATKVRIEKLKRVVEEQKARKDEYAEIISQQSKADAMALTGLVALGYEYINLDDCWAELNRDSQGNLVLHKTKFPPGIKSLADYVHSKALKLGFYSDARTQTCSKTMSGSLGFEEQEAKTFASWV